MYQSDSQTGSANVRKSDYYRHLGLKSDYKLTFDYHLSDFQKRWKTKLVKKFITSYGVSH